MSRVVCRHERHYGAGCDLFFLSTQWQSPHPSCKSGFDTIHDFLLYRTAAVVQGESWSSLPKGTSVVNHQLANHNELKEMRSENLDQRKIL